MDTSEEILLRSALLKSNVAIEFKKLDSSLRVLVSTPDIPAAKKPKKKTPPEAVGPILNVFDSVLQEWRSVRVSSIVSWSVDK